MLIRAFVLGMHSDVAYFLAYICVFILGQWQDADTDDVIHSVPCFSNSCRNWVSIASTETPCYSSIVVRCLAASILAFQRTRRLQAALNATARAITATRPNEHITSWRVSLAARTSLSAFTVDVYGICRSVASVDGRTMLRSVEYVKLTDRRTAAGSNCVICCLNINIYIIGNNWKCASL